MKLTLPSVSQRTHFDLRSGLETASVQVLAEFQQQAEAAASGVPAHCMQVTRNRHGGAAGQRGRIACIHGSGYAPNRVATPETMARRVLVVDDEPTVGDSISQVLVMDQYEVETVTSGQAALDAFQRGKFDLIIVDYEMPAMKGDKLAAAIKTLCPQQPIMMITAYSESLRFAGRYPLPVDLVISKPFALQEFREAVRRLARKT